MSLLGIAIGVAAILVGALVAVSTSRGRHAERSKSDKKDAEASARVAKAALRGPRGKRALLKRLRDHGL
ncbi:MAG: hypothetical protein ACE5FA_04050 [Dehalococcoidia bacterium]